MNEIPIGVSAEMAREPHEKRLDWPSKITAESAKSATKLFDTVELMEYILLQLSASDVLTAMGAVRSMHDTLIGSTKVQKHIGLLPDPSSEFRMPTMPLYYTPNSSSPRPFQIFYGLYFHDDLGTFKNLSVATRVLRTEAYDRDHIAAFSFEVYHEGPFLQKLGPRVQKMLPFQPPVTEVEVCLRCENCVPGLWPPPGSRSPEWWYPTTIKPRDGKFITFGDLQRAAVCKRTEHRKLCTKPRARSTVDLRMCGEVQISL